MKKRIYRNGGFFALGLLLGIAFVYGPSSPISITKKESILATSTPMSLNQEKNTGKTWRTFVKPSQDVLKQELTPIQYKVTQEEGTEKPFTNEYADNHAEGIYVDIVSGEPLFSSTDKYDSGTGWPSFTKPITEENIVEREDKHLFSVRTEVRSKHGDSHLGHVFPDGPAPTGMRFCMNSAALRFIPKEKMEEEGYGDYLYLFSNK